MPKIQWTGLPPALRDHLFERLRERKITAEDLYRLKAWRESEPEAPDGPRYKDFRLLQDLRRRTVSEDVSAPRPTCQRGKTLDPELKGVRPRSSGSMRGVRVFRKPNEYGGQCPVECFNEG